MATEVKIKLVGVCNVCIYSCPSWNIATSSNLEKRFGKCSLSCLYSSTVMKNTSFYSPLASFRHIKCHRTVWNVPLHQPWRFDKDTGWLSSTLHNTAPPAHQNFPAQTEELHRHLYLELAASVWIDQLRKRVPPFCTFFYYSCWRLVLSSHMDFSSSAMLWGFLTYLRSMIFQFRAPFYQINTSLHAHSTRWTEC